MSGVLIGTQDTDWYRLTEYPNWKPYKIETKDIGIQAYHVVLQLGVGYRRMV
jgi:hypothetical protein